MKKSYRIKTYPFGYKFVLIEWKDIFISDKYILLKINLCWLNKIIFWCHVNIFYWI